MHPLRAVDWRLERADQHLAALDEERRTFLDEKDHSVVGDLDRDASEYVFRLTGDLPDPRLGLVVGEFGHHLRAALDNLLWQLVLLRGGSPTTKTQFPIYECRERYESSVWMLRGVSADDRALIEEIQPYHLGDKTRQSYLALLAWLNNVDKHRFLHVGCAIPTTLRIQVFYRDAGGPTTGQFPWFPRIVRDIAEVTYVKYSPFIGGDDRAELARVGFLPNGPNPEVEMQGELRLNVVFSDPQGALLLDDLSIMRDMVGGIVDAFRPRFNILG